MIQNKERDSNIELLRIICIIGILLMHNYVLIPYQELSTINQSLIYLVNIGNFGVCTFVLISGYYGLKFKGYRFIQLILLTTIYHFIVYLINNGFTFNLNLLKALLVIPLYKNWFITCYLFLMILAPFIDSLIENLNLQKYQCLLIILFIGLSVLPTLFNTPYYTILYNGEKCLTYMIFVYLVGRYLKLYGEKYMSSFSNRTLITTYTILNMIIIAINFTLGSLFNQTCLIYAMDCSPLILMASITIFYYFKNISLQSKFINYLASSVLAVYLLDGIRFPIDRHIIHLNQYSHSSIYILVLFVEVILTFILAIAIDKIRILLFGKIEYYLINNILSYKYFKKLETVIK